jgi:EAL domain-containing protein (putative c-di-GMP-specific phosphodiesterase class I)
VLFEVTETTAIANLDDAADFIREMRSIGCRFALDDFGAGLSSYGYLKHLPVDYVKIDGVFIKDIVNDKSDYAMVKSITEMVKFLGMKTVAEYVETEEILELLRDIGVDYAQGYGIEKPIPLGQVLAMEGDQRDLAALY